MKKLSKLTAILSLCFAASLVSCSNLIDGEGSSSASKTASKKAWITVDVENKDSSSRTLLPAIEITNLVLKGSLSGQEEERLASADTLVLMNAKNIEITTGEWTFTLTADVSGASYSGSTTKTIQENSENPLTFTLSPESGARGKLDFTLTLTEDSAKNIDSSYKAKIELKNLATSVTEEADAEITSKISYKNNSLEEGNYLLTVNILSDKITAASDAEKLLNTFQSIVRIKAGITTTASIKDINLNDIYSITYENIEDDDSLVSGSVTQVHKFSRKTTGTGKIIIPEYENTSPTGTLTFDGWYYDNAFTQTAELEKDGSSYYIDVNSSPKLKDYTIYAKWLVSASGNISTPFDYNFTFDLKTQKDSPARTILPEQETTFKLTTAVTKNGTAIPLTIEDGKTFLDDKEVTWTANLWNDGKLAESITVTPDAATDKINLTVPALTFQDTYILKITANYCGLSFDANYLIKCEPKNPMLTVPLTLEAIEAGVVVTFTNKAAVSVTYRVNGGSAQTIPSGESTPITLTATGDKVAFYGDNATYGVSSDTVSDNTNISCSKNCYVYGNIMSLIKSSDFENETELTGSYVFKNLFRDNTKIFNKEGQSLLLPATTVKNNCYYSMFQGCTGLTTAPALPAATMKEECYNSMFQGCTSLAAAPELPATTLASSCYAQMFQDCTSLTSAPALPATKLLKSCYFGMFYGCTSLTKAPALPAKELNEYCYHSMFAGCTGLTSAPELPATTLEGGCYQEMFQGCTGLTAAPELPATTLALLCYYSMFKECSGLTSAPALPATTLASSCYYQMFQGCTSLNSVTCLATDISANDCTTDWLSGVADTGTFTKAPGMTGWTSGSSGIPTGWTVEGDIVNISAADLTETNYETVTNITLDSEAGMTNLINLAKKNGDENGKTFEGKTITLDSNITLSSGQYFETEFLGTFDGNGKTIYGLGEVQFLFEKIGNSSKTDAVIKNLTVEGSSSMSTFAKSVYGTISNCVSNVTITNSGEGNTGGICAILDKGVIENCINKGNISSTLGHIGGICGISSGFINNCINEGEITTSGTVSYVGGIAGSFQGTIINCVNKKNITAPNAHRVAGIAGQLSESSYEIANCYNTGSVTGNDMVGGIAGSLGQSTSSGGTVKNCYNKGLVTGSSDTGGIVGKTVNDKVIIQHNFYAQSSASQGVGGEDDNTGKVESFDDTSSSALDNLKTALNSWVNDSSNKPIPEDKYGSYTFKKWEITLGSDGYPTFKEN